MSQLPCLDVDNLAFPPIENALKEPDGLLAFGGDLSSERLLDAYANGIFPWYEEGQPILWWSPAPRAVLLSGQLHISKSLKKTLRKKTFSVTFDTAFETVIRACAAPRKNQQGTWITEDMIQAYLELHRLGYAHSVECWQHGNVVGGLYGISLGSLFFGESMFATETDASKVAFTHLASHCEAWSFPLIDCQIPNDHLESLGVTTISRAVFKKHLECCIPEKSDYDIHKGKWANRFQL